MKSKIGIIFLISLMSASLSACAGAATKSAPSVSGGAGSQLAEASAGSSAGSASSADGQGTSTADTYKAVLRNEARFVSADDHSEFLLKNFLSRNSEYEGTYQVTQFAVLDMDQDQIPEVILELSLNGYPEQYEILHESNGNVYGYNIVYRGFEMLKADGTYRYANSATDVGVQRILNFRPDSVETEILGYTQSDYSGGNINVLYFISNASVTKEVFDAFLDQQNAKSNAQWYGFSAENIDAKV